jgi:small subunit ribosomal protein S16
MWPTSQERSWNSRILYFHFVFFFHPMLTIRLSRIGKHKHPIFRVVLTEHSKSAQKWFQEILGSYDAVNHKLVLDVAKIKEYVSHGAGMSERVARLAYQESKDELFTKFFVKRDLKRAPKKDAK